MSSFRLPVTWPLAALFVAFPVWWLLGVSAFTWPVIAVLMLMAMVWRRWARLPMAAILWFAFISWVLLSGLQLTGGAKILTFSYRLSLYVAAGIIFLYVYNLPRASRVDGKVLRILTIFWIVVVAGGYAGILLRSATFVPPFEHLIPRGIRDKAFVQQLVQPVFAQVQSFLGFPVPRPAAPFTYTNEWGGNIAVLTPVAFAMVTAAPSRAWRRTVLAVLFLSLVPMVFSLNRGMFLSLAIGIAYVTARVAARGRVGALVSIIGLTAVMVAAVALSPLGGLVTQSFKSTHGNSNVTRLMLYERAARGANASPLFGYGATAYAYGQSSSAAISPASTTGTPAASVPAIGSQGQLWTVLYSNGYPALVFFIGFFLAVLWQTRRARGGAGLWLHSVPLVALAQIVVYGWLPVELQVIMVAAALAYRRCWRTADPAPGRGRADAGARPALPEPAVADGSLTPSAAVP